MTIRLHRGDLPDMSRYMVQAQARSRSTPKPWGSMSTATGCAWCSFRPATAPPTWCRFRANVADAPNLKRLLADAKLLKIFHFARFDLGMLYKAFGVMPEPVYCTKIASRLARTYTDKHGLKDLVREVLGQDLSKQQQSSDWGAAELTEAQVSYAAADVTICTRSGTSSMPCWRARAAKSWPRPASASCRSGCGSTSRALPPRTFSPIPEGG